MAPASALMSSGVRALERSLNLWIRYIQPSQHTGGFLGKNVTRGRRNDALTGKQANAFPTLGREACESVRVGARLPLTSRDPLRDELAYV
jgi:hypothetical protein